MKRKNILALALALLMLLSLAPAVYAAELPFPAEWFDGLGGVSLRSLIDENRDQIDLAGGSFQLENILFLEENVVDEELELCICETNENATIVDEKTLPDGCRIELRREKVRIPDAKTGVEVAEEIRAEKAGRRFEPEEKRIDPADRDRETWYLYLIGRPTQTGNSIFVIWDGAIRLCQVEVLSEKPDHDEAPAVEETWVEPDSPAAQEEPPVNQEWVDPWAPAAEPPAQQDDPMPPAPVFVLPTPSVTVTGAAAVQQGESVLLTAQVSNDYNPGYQWYVSSESHPEWQPLSGETGSQYRPDTSAAGVWFYLCEVKNYGDTGETTTAYSEPATVQVEAKQELPTPTVVGVTGATRVEQGQSAVLEVQVTNTYNASYQWYEGQTPIADGSGNSAQYRPDTSEAGTQVYTVLVVNNGENNQTAYAFSEPVTFTVDAKPTLPRPSVSVTGSTSVTAGDSAVLEVQVKDGYNLSYQWFNSLGSYDAPIQSSDATSSRFRPDTSRAGTYTYFCRVTSSGYGQTVTVDSEPVTFTVNERQVRQIKEVSVDAMPAKTTYTDGERLDTTGLRLLVWYNDGTFERVTSGFTAEPATVRYNATGMVDAIIRYRGYSVTLPLNVRQQNRQISKVTIDTMPGKLTYNDGDRLDTTGLVLLIQYSDGTYERVSSGFTAGPTVIKYNNTSTANVAVRYQGYTVTYQINVRSSQQSAAEKLSYIRIKSMPSKTSYTVGEYLDTTGLMITAYSNDGRTLDIGEGFECSPTRFNGTGNQTVTVSFLGKTTTFTVAVQEARRVYGLTITSMPANRSYASGDTINTAGLVLQLQTNSGYETITSGYSISPRVVSGTGTQMVTVSYEGLTANYTVEVHENNIPRVSPTPASAPTPAVTMPGVSPVPSGMPSPSAMPGVSASPAPLVTPRPVTTPAPARRNTGVSTLVKVLFVVAVLALAGLIGYVLYLRKHDTEDGYDVPREDSPSEKLHKLFSKKDKDDR